MERTVKVAVDAAGGIAPATPQYAGVQGEHNACRVVFDVSAWGDEPFLYRGEFVSGDGAGGTTAVLEVVDGCVSFPLPAAWTAAGGRAAARLVASVTVDGEETQTVFAVDVPLYFAVKQEYADTVKTEEHAGLTALAASVQAAVDEVEAKLADGSFVGAPGRDGYTPYVGENENWWTNGADTGRPSRGAQGVSGVYVGSGEMPDGYNVQVDPDGEAMQRMEIGTVETLPAGSAATATIGGTVTDPVLNLGIPQGAAGQPGKDGNDGETPHIGANGNWWVGDTDTGTKAQGEAGQDLTEKPWTLIESTTLAEAISQYIPTIPADTYKELYIECVMQIETTETSAKSIQFRIGRSTTYVGLASTLSVSDGSKAYYKAKMELDVKGKEQFTVTASAYSYMGTMMKNAGDVNSIHTFEHIPSVAIWLVSNTHFFGVGSTFKVWGR